MAFYDLAGHHISTPNPLTVPRLWPDGIGMVPDDPVLYNNEFQSNALEYSRDTSSLAGLGIRYFGHGADTPLQDKSCRADDPLLECNLASVDLTTTSSEDASWGLMEDSLFSTPGYDTSVGSVSQSDLSLDLGDLAHSFQRLSSLSGLSVQDFATQLAASAEATLQHLIPNDSSSGYFSATNHLNKEAQRLGWPSLPSPTIQPTCPEELLLRPSSSGGSIGVNPSDLMPHPPQDPSAGSVATTPDPEETPRQTFHSQEASPESILMEEHGHPSLALSPVPLPFSMEPVDFPQAHSAFTPPSTHDPLVPSDDDHDVSFRSPISSDYSPSMECDDDQDFAAKYRKRRLLRARQMDAHSPSPDQMDSGDSTDLPDINLGTPVFDAHRGVELEELKAKAERYRLRNHGRDYDKRWLISFAGKLSTRGELVDEFRCYIIGCCQTNKRRDHILIHVGAHLDQRPFRCPHWYVVPLFDDDI